MTIETFLDARKTAGKTKRTRSMFALRTAAGSTFKTKTYPEATVEDISATAGLAPKTFYAVFKNKAAIAASLIDSAFETKSSSLEDSVQKLITINTEYPAILQAVANLRLTSMQYEDIVPLAYREVSRNISVGQWLGQFRTEYSPETYGSYILDTVCILGGETQDRITQRAEIALGSISLRNTE